MKPGQMVTMDWYPDRLVLSTRRLPIQSIANIRRVNVHIGDDNVCTHVSMG